MKSIRIIKKILFLIFLFTCIQIFWTQFDYFFKCETVCEAKVSYLVASLSMCFLDLNAYHWTSENVIPCFKRYLGWRNLCSILCNCTKFYAPCAYYMKEHECILCDHSSPGLLLWYFFCIFCEIFSILLQGFMQLECTNNLL